MWLNFVSAVKDAKEPHLSIPPFDWQILGVAHACMNLQDSVHHSICHIGPIQFCHGCLVPIIHPLVSHPGSPVRHPARSLNFHRTIRYHPLDGLPVCQAFTKAHPRIAVFKDQWLLWIQNRARCPESYAPPRSV